MYEKPNYENYSLNELVEALAAIRISGEEMQCLWVILRKTYGWKKKEDWIALSQFTDMTGINKGNVRRALNKLIDKNMVVKKDYLRGKSYCFQKNYQEWVGVVKKDTSSQKRLRGESIKTTKMESIKTTTKETTKETITKESIYSVFVLWNEQGITKHKTIDKHKPSINAAIKEYSEGEIKKAIINYNTILTDPIYYWTHKWTLKEFLQRGLDKFRDENKPFDNYKSDRKGGSRGENQGARRPEKGKYDHLDK